MSSSYKKNAGIAKRGIYKKLTACVIISLIASGLYIGAIDKQVWSISVYTATSPYDFSPHPHIQNAPVLTADKVSDATANFVADPFMTRYHGKWFMFFEVLNSSSGHGDIGLASSNDGLKWQYEQIILDEPFHLSYPYIFEWNGDYYMLPESRETKSVRLYRADRFPITWTYIKELITGDFADPSIIYRNKKWWLFLLEGRDNLSLYYADDLTGPWIEHPYSPIVRGDKNISRPAGRLLVVDDKILRYVQDGEPEYGSSVRVFQVDVLTTTHYKDHEVTQDPILAGSGEGWNSVGMHHIDAHQLENGHWIACVDGKRKELIFDFKRGARQLLKQIRN